MRAGDRADAVERVGDVRDPVAQGLVHRVLEGLGAGLDRDDLGAEHLHAEDVRLLPLDIDCAHVDDAVEREAGAERRGRDAVLARTGLGDDPPLAHASGDEDLAEHVVHLVGAGVVQLVALEVDLRAAEMLGQALGEVERARSADVMGQVGGHLGLEGRVGLGLAVGLLELEDQRHQRLGDETAAEDAEMPAFVRAGAEGVGLRLSGHATLSLGLSRPAQAARAARTKRSIFSGSFSPGRRSTPEETSSARTQLSAIAAATLSGASPPDNMTASAGSSPATSRQSKATPLPPGSASALFGGFASRSSRSATSA